MRSFCYTYVIAGKGKIKGKDSLIGVIVKQYPNENKGNKFYVHEVIEIGAETDAVANNGEANVNFSTPNYNGIITQDNTIVNNNGMRNSRDYSSSGNPNVTDIDKAINNAYISDIGLEKIELSNNGGFINLEKNTKNNSFFYGKIENDGNTYSIYPDTRIKERAWDSLYSQWFDIKRTGTGNTITVEKPLVIKFNTHSGRFDLLDKGMISVSEASEYDKRGTNAIEAPAVQYPASVNVNTPEPSTRSSVGNSTLHPVNNADDSNGSVPQPDGIVKRVENPNNFIKENDDVERIKELNSRRSRTVEENKEYANLVREQFGKDTKG